MRHEMRHAPHFEWPSQVAEAAESSVARWFRSMGEWVDDMVAAAWLSGQLVSHIEDVDTPGVYKHYRVRLVDGTLWAERMWRTVWAGALCFRSPRAPGFGAVRV